MPTPEKQLNIYNWDAYIGETTRQDFEKKYGIKVNYDKFPDASTQITKIRSDGKGGGYDLTYPASTDVAPLARDGVIAALDLSLIPNIKNLGPAWQDPAYDPGNKHSVPNYWWTTGIAWDPDKVKKDITSWTALWDETYKGKMGMLSDQQEVFAAGAFRLGLNPNPTSDADLDAILALLETQKPLLRKYTEDDIGDFTSGQLWMTQAWSGDWVQMTYEKPKAKYVIPSEGAIRGSDMMVVLSGAQAPDRGPPVDRLQPRRQGQRRELELHRLHGAQRRGAGVHRPGDPRQPAAQPRRRRVQRRWSSSSRSKARPSTTMTKRWIELTT